MRSPPPLYRASHALSAAVIAFGCGGRTERGFFPGASNVAAEAEPPPPRRPPAPRQRWEHYEEVLGWPPARTEFPSLGHFSARYAAAVHVGGGAREAYLNLVAGSRLPVGTIVAELHHDPRTGRRGPLFAMHKLALDRWEYLVADAEGWIEERGDLPLCRRCHADGLADQLFGPPGRAD